MVFTRSFAKIALTIGTALALLTSAGCGQHQSSSVSAVAAEQGASAQIDPTALFYQFPLSSFAWVRAVDPQLGRVQAVVAKADGVYVLDVKVGHGYRASRTRLWLASGAVTFYPGEPKQRDIVTAQAPSKGGDRAGYLAALAPLPAQLKAAGAPAAAVAYVESVLALVQAP